jgi:hypothetical protein
MKQRYRMRYRPTDRFTLPAGLDWDYVEAPHAFAHKRPDIPRSDYRFGVFTTSRPLTDDELQMYEIDKVPS